MRSLFGRPVLLAIIVSLSACGRFRPAAEPAPERTAAQEAAIHAPMRALTTDPQEFLATARGTYVVVDLDSNLLRVMQDETMLWEAPVGTGTGLRLKGTDGAWHFTTPRGVFQVMYKEELPIWILPDWYYVEKKLPIPPQDDPARRLPGQLGVAAVYLGEEIAIHGTERPELLGQRVSHGCIRLSNRNAMRLFHNVQIGTPVVVMGGEALDTLPPPPSTDPGKAKPKAPDPLAGVSTADILARLRSALILADTGSDWVPLASRLITRGLKDDAPALRGLLELAGIAGSDRLNSEYATFLADAFSRGSLRAVVSLARIDESARERAARAIVRATMSLSPLAPDAPGAPWPTGRIPPDRLGPAGRSGWEALADAEAAYRVTRAAAPSRVREGR